MTLSEHKLATRKFLAQRSGVESLASSRGLTFGGAGASLALILLIAQIGVTKTAVQWSLGFAAAALPLWLALALTYDAWLALKLDFHDLYELRWLQLIQAWWFNFTGALTFLSIACLVYSLSTSIGHVFIGASLVGFVLIGAAILAAAYRIRHHMGRAQQGSAQSDDA